MTYLRPYFRLNDNESDKLWELIYYHQLTVSQKFNNRPGTKQAFILMINIVRRIPIAVDLNYHKILKYVYILYQTWFCLIIRFKYKICVATVRPPTTE